MLAVMTVTIQHHVEGRIAMVIDIYIDLISLLWVYITTVCRTQS